MSKIEAEQRNKIKTANTTSVKSLLLSDLPRVIHENNPFKTEESQLFHEGSTMRTYLVAIGLVLLFVGLFLISHARTAASVPKQERPIIRVGEKDATEIADINFANGEKFYVSYTGGGRYTNPEDIIVIVFDPFGNETALSYERAGPIGRGIIANYTGTYNVTMGGQGLIDPYSPFFMSVRKIIDSVSVEYPNSNVFPVGLSVFAVGVAFSAVGVVLPRKKLSRNKTRKK